MELVEVADKQVYHDLLVAGFSESDAAYLVDLNLCRRHLVRKLDREPTPEEVIDLWRRM